MIVIIASVFIINTMNVVVNLDLAKEIVRLRTTQVADPEGVARDYCKWLSLVAKHSEESQVPSETIDEMWHIHLENAKKYRADCTLIFGTKELLHDTTAPEPALQQGWQNTQRRWKENYGEPLPGSRAFCRTNLAATRGGR